MADRKAQLRENLAATRAEIERLSAQADRKPPQLLPVTKLHPAADIALLAELGVSDVAENREQEARAKAAELPQLRFHMILSLIHISEPTRPVCSSRMPSSA